MNKVGRDNRGKSPLRRPKEIVLLRAPGVEKVGLFPKTFIQGRPLIAIRADLR